MQGVILWLTGLSGSGKSTLAQYLTPRLRELGCKVEVLDGEEVRENLSMGLGFTKEDRDTNVLRIGWVANLLARNGVVAIAPCISPHAHARREIRSRADAAFVEVYVKCPLDIAEERDTKGLYKKAREGIIKNFTGISDPYDEPEHAEVVVDTSTESIEESAAKILAYLNDLGFVETEVGFEEPGTPAEHSADMAADHPTDFEIRFDPRTPPEAVHDTVRAMGDFFRACGGSGLIFRFSEEEAEARVEEFS